MVYEDLHLKETEHSYGETVRGNTNLKVLEIKSVKSLECNNKDIYLNKRLTVFVARKSFSS